MKILLINVDSKFNIAIRRMYNYFKNENEVEMIDLKLNGYTSKKIITIDGRNYDKIYCSNIFEVNKYSVYIINNNNIIYGGIGSREPERQLPKEIEETEPFYFPEEQISYGFITRGCIRNCWFCKVPKYEGKLKFYNSIDKIVKHKKVKFLDNNILAYEDHMKVFNYLIEKNIRCEFNQGLDFRLLTEENSEALSKLNYMGEYIFAFDDFKYKQAIEKKIAIFKKYVNKDWKIKFYIYHNDDNMKIEDLLYRLDWCKKNKFLPYVMRDQNCYNSKYDLFYKDISAYANQPAFFKKLSFEQFLHIRYSEGRKTKNEIRIEYSLKVYNKFKKGEKING